MGPMVVGYTALFVLLKLVVDCPQRPPKYENATKDEFPPNERLIGELRQTGSQNCLKMNHEEDLFT